MLFGQNSQVQRNLLSKVKFASYDCLLSAVHVNNNHWNLLFVHAAEKKVYLIDPFKNAPEMEASEKAADKFKEYLNMRRQHQHSDWANINWEGGVLKHPCQQDGNSCGVVVAMMAKEIIHYFPEIPEFSFSTTRAHMIKGRRLLAFDLLQGSVFQNDSWCVMCASKKTPISACKVEWIQCDTCDRWYHADCIGLSTKDVKKAAGEVEWKCLVCK
uniref:PHD-type domain-containing protein n=1 Tax=Knipowitschia caucasica TaxID=637954 RepID=A0AAV2IZH2_KNICA